MKEQWKYRLHNGGCLGFNALWYNCITKKKCPKANFVVTGGTVGCHNDNPGATSDYIIVIMTTLGFQWYYLQAVVRQSAPNH